MIIAMWSGPRNVSTALMRSFENRGDTVVWDEPLYAYYLAQTQKPHPGFDEIIKAHPTDWHQICELAQAIPENNKKASVYYQKHMTHHLLNEIDYGWLDQLTNCFLIRNPRQVISSYVKQYSDIGVEDIGITQQIKLYDYLRTKNGKAPIVIDGEDLLKQPQAMLQKLCDALKISFEPSMLSWPAGERDSDGVWAKHWYESVWNSTGFKAYQPSKIELNAAQEDIAASAMDAYLQMSEYKL